MAKIRVSTSSMKQDAETLKELAESIPTLVSELEGSMSQLAGCWEGDAWTMYQSTMAEYVEILGEIYTDIGKYASKYSEGAKQYLHADQDACIDIDLIVVL